MNISPRTLLGESVLDVSDAWLEVMDPEGERGETATAVFEHETGQAWTHDLAVVEVSCPILTKIEVETDAGLLTYDREFALTAFGPKWVRRIEGEQYDRIN